MNVMTIPPATVRMPFARCDGSCDLSDKPTCKMPKPSKIRPTARIREKDKIAQVIDNGKRITVRRERRDNKTASMKNTLAKME